MVRYYYFSGMGDVSPHFYCDSCSNVFFRQSDRDRIRERQPSAELLEAIAQTLPGCPCGGRFVPGANPKCPHCHREIPHRADPVSRLDDPYAILLEGALMVTDDEGNTGA
ncbi:MAG: hypothetical protein NEA02_06390 [Thermoanaerobaculia bacterium]|nr:hypothetical protein [Thermoanaerobaculia bacterium]